MNAENDYNDIGALRPRSNDKIDTEQTQRNHEAFFKKCVLGRVYEEIANAGISTTNEQRAKVNVELARRAAWRPTTSPSAASSSEMSAASTRPSRGGAT